MEDTGKTIALIKALSGGGSGGLPTVTASDNGKVLTVENGAWTADSNALIVHFIYQNGYNTSSHTASEIKAAVDSGRPVFAFDSSGALYVLSQSVGSYATFVSIFGSSNAVTKRYVGNNGSVNVYNCSMVPTVSVSENGFELIGKDGAWAKQQKKFIVTLTPTAADYSGTMDKTVAEINAAYEAGQEIMFRLMSSETQHMDVDCTARWYTDTTYPSFNGFIVDDGHNLLIEAFTSATNDGTKQTYGTAIYTLTPAT